MLVRKDLDRKVYYYIDPWGETLYSVAWALRDSYHHTLSFMLGQVIFGRYLLLNFTSIVYWYFITARKKWWVDINNDRENYR